MGLAAAVLFARAQRAQFYVEMTAGALALLPPGRGRTLLDAGCGPGLLARQAGVLGFAVTGVDRDPAMVAAARLLSVGQPGVEFACTSAQELAAGGSTFDVVAAASLLAVASDPRALLRTLWALTAPGGSLLVVEPTAAMTVQAANALRAGGQLGAGAGILPRWAAAREGRTFDPALLERLPGARRRQADLVSGLVRATVLTRASAGPPPGSTDRGKR